MSDIRTRSSYDWHMSSNANSTTFICLVYVTCHVYAWNVSGIYLAYALHMLFAMYMPGISLAYSGGSGLPMMQKTLIEKSRNIVAKASVGRACGTNARNAEAQPCPCRAVCSLQKIGRSQQASTEFTHRPQSTRRARARHREEGAYTHYGAAWTVAKLCAAAAGRGAPGEAQRGSPACRRRSRSGGWA